MKLEDLEKIVDEFKITESTSDEEKRTALLFWIARDIHDMKRELQRNLHQIAMIVTRQHKAGN